MFTPYEIMSIFVDFSFAVDIIENEIFMRKSIDKRLELLEWVIDKFICIIAKYSLSLIVHG